MKSDQLTIMVDLASKATRLILWMMPSPPYDCRETQHLKETEELFGPGNGHFIFSSNGTYSQFHPILNLACMIYRKCQGIILRSKNSRTIKISSWYAHKCKPSLIWPFHPLSLKIQFNWELIWYLQLCVCFFPVYCSFSALAQLLGTTPGQPVSYVPQHLIHKDSQLVSYEIGGQWMSRRGADDDFGRTRCYTDLRMSSIKSLKRIQIHVFWASCWGFIS